MYVKVFVAFIVGALVYNLIDSMKSCNLKVVEGADGDDPPPTAPTPETDPDPGTPPDDDVPPTNNETIIHLFNPVPTVASCMSDTSKNGDDPAPQASCKKLKSQKKCKNSISGCKWVVPPTAQNTLHKKDVTEIIAVIKTQLFDTDISSIGSPFLNLLKKLAKVTNTGTTADVFTSASGIFYNINSLSDLGDPFHSEALDLIELIIRNFIKSPSDALKTDMANFLFDGEDICANDINIYVYAFTLLLYSEKSDAIEDEKMGHILNISNKLSKYIPDILDKIQDLYKNCPETSPHDPKKAKLVSGIYHKLFKNNKTIINFNGISDLMENLENVKTIYIVLFMICATFVLVKFMGMFGMKVNI